MSCASLNGSPQQILLLQLPFANEPKPHYLCKAFWAQCHTFGVIGMTLRFGLGPKIIDSVCTKLFPTNDYIH